MKFSFFIAALMMVSTAFASEVVSRKLSWSPLTNSGWSTTYYSCSFAESQVESHLKSLGAQNVRVSCSGGIEMGWSMPVMIDARFDAVVPSGNDTTSNVKLRNHGEDSCSFNVEFLDRVIPMFPGVTVNSKRSSCMGSRTDSWSYDLTVTL